MCIHVYICVYIYIYTYIYIYLFINIYIYIRSTWPIPRPPRRPSGWHEPEWCIEAEETLFSYVLQIIQLTPQKLSAERKNRSGAKGASAWPEDQKRHRGRRPGCRRYREVLVFFLSFKSYNSHHKSWAQSGEITPAPKASARGQKTRRGIEGEPPCCCISFISYNSHHNSGLKVRLG